MKCPVCVDSTLDPKNSHGIEVTVCPTCDGVWLGRSEFDKLMATTAGSESVETLGEPTWSTENEAPANDARVNSEPQGERKEWKSDRRKTDRDSGPPDS